MHQDPAHHSKIKPIKPIEQAILPIKPNLT